MGSDSRPGSGDAPLDDLVEKCVLALDRGDSTFVDRLCASRPEFADDLRQRIASLRRIGLLSSDVLEIDNYRIERRLGEGGMGVVHLAWQEVPVRRRVAVKVIRSGSSTAEVLARFEQERQVLAMLDHSDIARVYDAGVTRRGEPFFAMEFVDGVPITDFCERESIDCAERLRLFIRVCDAVHHAHSKGIIHRDIKPSNVLVGRQDGHAFAKVIDFGVAKAALGSSTRGRVETESNQVLGTPEYMSPEQAAMAGDAVDGRTDVYSLGVLLYELLCGSLPHESSRLRRASPGERERILRDEAAPAPSSRFGQHRDRATSSLRRRIVGDLDWITLKAIEKEPVRRYASPVELADDVRRHLADLPVRARPPSAWYRWRKLVRRRRAGVAVAGIAGVALAVSGGLYFDARDARADEKVAVAAADDNLELALRAADELLARAGAIQVSGTPQSEVLRKDLAEMATRLHQQLLERRHDSPPQRLRAARAHTHAARIRLALAELDRADEHLERAAELFGGMPAPTRRSDLAVSVGTQIALDRARLEGRRGHREDANRVLRDRLDALATFDDDQRSVWLARFRLWFQFGQAAVGVDTTHALDAFDAADRLAAELWVDRGQERPDPKEDLLAAKFYGEYASLLARAGQLERAQRMMGDNDVRFARVLEVAPRGSPTRNRLAHHHLEHARQARDLDRLDDSIRHFEKAIEIGEALCVDFPDSPGLTEFVAIAHASLASTLVNVGRIEAIAEIERAIHVQRSLAERYRDEVRLKRRLATLLGTKAQMLVTLHAFRLPAPLDEASPAAIEAIEILKAARGLALDPRVLERELGWAHQSAGSAALALGRPVEAQGQFRAATDHYLALAADDEADVELQQGIAVCEQKIGESLSRAGEFDRAVEPLERSVAAFERVLARSPQNIPVQRSLKGSLALLGTAALENGDVDAASRCAEQVVIHCSAEVNPRQVAADLLAGCVSRAPATEVDAWVVRALEAVDASLAADQATYAGSPMLAWTVAKYQRLGASVCRDGGLVDAGLVRLDDAAERYRSLGATARGSDTASRYLRRTARDAVFLLVQNRRYAELARRSWRGLRAMSPP